MFSHLGREGCVENERRGDGVEEVEEERRRGMKARGVWREAQVCVTRKREEAAQRPEAAPGCVTLGYPLSAAYFLCGSNLHADHQAAPCSQRQTP